MVDAMPVLPFRGTINAQTDAKSVPLRDGKKLSVEQNSIGLKTEPKLHTRCKLGSQDC